MRQLNVVRLALLAALAAFWLAADAHAAKKSDAEVKVTAAADKPDADGKQAVTVTVAINKGWHLYANPVGNDDYAENQTTVTVTAGGKALDAKVDYPEGKLVVDKFAGNYKVYEGTVTIKAVVQRAKGEAGPLDVLVKIQACSDKTCLLPATVKVTVP